MVIMIVQPDFSIGHDFGALGQRTKCLIPVFDDFLGFMRMNPDSGKHGWIRFGQGDGGPAGGYVAADRDQGFNAGGLGTPEDLVPVVIVSGIVQMHVTVDQHHAFLSVVKFLKKTTLSLIA